MDYEEKIIYLPFKIKNSREKMTRVKFIYIICSELSWTDPETADKILEIAINRNYLKKEGKQIYLKNIKKSIPDLKPKDVEFDIEKLIVRIEGFEDPKTEVEKTANIVLKKTENYKRKEIIKSINKIKDKNDCTVKEACDTYIDQFM